MRIRILTCGLVLATGFTATALADDGVTITVGETVTLEAEEAPLNQVLFEIGEAVPLELSSRGTEVEDPVSLAIEAKDWPDLLSRLLGRTSYVLSFDAATGQPQRLVVLWDKVRESLGDTPAGYGVPAGDSAQDDVEARIRAAAEEVLAPPDRAGEAIARLESAHQRFLSAQAALIKAQSSGDANAGALAKTYEQARAAYLAAIGGLEGHDEARTVDALLPAFEIDDREARMKALETARWLSQTGRNPKAVEHATSAFETAEDEAVERAALEVLVRYGDEEEVLRMIEPLALQEGPNRDLAVREWLRIRDEQKAREEGQDQIDFQNGESQ